MIYHDHIIYVYRDHLYPQVDTWPQKLATYGLDVLGQPGWCRAARAPKTK